ncbi:pre-RNA processing PIH1/Nop17 protein [Melghirimyces profundicolus]|uniref:Pre-RNA processing PIH1/Nop17 protein n=1 Tax=Melghirimyces profundicolus TaxID=1242148 RepID=A0A2T6BG59_9BACL|nr:Hsp20/alpha crystallin family protein [Melghirimyces profundicolus]PTX55036.1 pre-RNA processing PIH1/Nop17 protein [Melghirimyces profundicolus]
MRWLKPWFESMYDEEMGELWNEWRNLSHDLEQNRMSTQCFQTATDVVVHVRIPQLNPRHEINVKVLENRILYISGSTGGKGNQRFQERFHFTLNVYLPVPVDAKRMNTGMDQEKKTLVIRMPKA